MMDTPLLALTRRRGASGPGPSAESTAVENMRQLAQLRWIAVAGQLITIAVVALVLGLPLPLAPMLGVAALLALANLAGAAWLASGRRVTGPALLLALLIDIGALTVQLYCSGGAANPFISLYLLQVVLGAILLEFWSAWVLVVVTSLCFAGLTVSHVPLVFPPGLIADSGALYAVGALIGFALTGALIGLFITRITRNLRARDGYLADLRQHAAEEDGIVRMGLFASGAAHELGTPLASLSVILNDWRRMPRLATDAELGGELAEMQAEVERCKAIVADILHSAGDSGVEMAELTDARAFLDDVAAAWRPTHPDVPLAFAADGLAGATLAAGGSLRQAIWNLLDNSAEASPRGIALAGTRHDRTLVVAITDDGPGFPPARLASVGRLYQSSKGAGHGVGLFLAANVARRLGGRLDARNRDEGGAEVSLTLPLARPEDR